MKNTIWQTIASTPWWFFVFCGYLVWTGFMTTKPRLVSLKTLAFMPLFFVGLSMMSMCAMLYSITYTHLAIWLGALFLGTGLGFLQFSIFNIKAVQHANSLFMPGSWSLLIGIFLGFAAMYYFGPQLSIDYRFLINPEYGMILVFFYGLATGLFLGKLGYGIRCLRLGPYLDAVIRAALH